MKKYLSGQSLVEIIVAMGVASIFLPTIIIGFTSSREGRVHQQKRLDATTFLKESVEALRSVRESGWENVDVNGDFHPEISGGAWVLVGGPETIGEFTRTITIKDALRDASGSLVTSGGSADPSTKEIVVNIVWDSTYPINVSSTLYLTRHLDNMVYEETLTSDFEEGTLDGIVVTTVDDGELQLASGGSSSWCSPNLDLTPLDLPKQGVANAISAIEGQVFVGTGDNASGVSFANVSITNENPPVPSITDTFDGYKTNDVFGEAEYAYLATDNNAKEVVIVGLSAPYTEEGSFNTPGPVNTDSVYVLGDIGYVTAGNTLYTFDLTAKTGERPALDADGVVLVGVAADMMVVGTNVYVSVNSGSTQMQIVDSTNPSDLKISGNISIDSSSGVSVFVNESQTRAYLATEESSSQDEMFIVDITDKTNPSLIGSYDSNGMNPTAVTVVPGNRSILVGTGAEEYQVISILDEASPVRCGGLNIDSGINGLSSVIESDGDTFSYIITGDHTQEFRAIEGGPGGGFSFTGEFESQIFDTTRSSAFNRLEMNVIEPNLTDASLQVAIADPAPDCESATYEYVGPDATINTYYEDSGVIPFDNDDSGFENPGQCFRYKVYLSSEEIVSSPIFTDILINLSP